MPDISVDILIRCVCEALEVTAFVIAEPLEASPEPAGPLTHTRVRFNGPASGELELICAESLAQTLRMSLGMDPSESPGGSPSPVDELANIICGMVLRATFGDGGTGEVGLPRTEPLKGPFDASSPDTCAFDADGSLVIARIIRRAA